MRITNEPKTITKIKRNANDVQNLQTLKKMDLVSSTIKNVSYRYIQSKRHFKYDSHHGLKNS